MNEYLTPWWKLFWAFIYQGDNEKKIWQDGIFFIVSDRNYEKIRGEDFCIKPEVTDFDNSSVTFSKCVAVVIKALGDIEHWRSIIVREAVDRWRERNPKSILLWQGSRVGTTKMFVLLDYFNMRFLFLRQNNNEWFPCSFFYLEVRQQCLPHES